MPQTYKFVVSMPVTDTLPRNRISNTVHLEHSIGALLDTDLSTMCSDIVSMYQKRYGNTTGEIQCKAYDVDAKPNYPRAVATVHAGTPWLNTHPREVAMCLSYAGANRGNKSERGRIYLMPGISGTSASATDRERPSQTVMDWTINFYTFANESFPDLGGVDWKFGIWSPTYQKFTQAKQAWCNDEWDTQRRRGLRETTRNSITRDG